MKVDLTKDDLTVIWCALNCLFETEIQDNANADSDMTEALKNAMPKVTEALKEIRKS